MRDDEVDALRLDVETLRKLVDVLLDEGRSGRDPLLQACAITLQDRRHRLDRLEDAGPPE
jgi:hypothetical protein